MKEKHRVVKMNYIDHALLFGFYFLDFEATKGSKEKQGNLTFIQYTIVYVLF